MAEEEEEEPAGNCASMAELLPLLLVFVLVPFSVLDSVSVLGVDKFDDIDIAGEEELDSEEDDDDDDGGGGGGGGAEFCGSVVRVRRFELDFWVEKVNEAEDDEGGRSSEASFPLSFMFSLVDLLFFLSMRACLFVCLGFCFVFFLFVFFFF